MTPDCCQIEAIAVGPALLSMALSTGLLGSGHCIGMCGGIVAALSMSRQDRGRGFLFQLCYHAGRLTTYGLIGLGAGWLGAVLIDSGSLRTLSRVIMLGADLLLIVAGLASAALSGGRNPLEREWAGPARLIGRAVRSLQKLSTPLAALPLGMLFGLLPCGMLYVMALAAAQSAAPAQGALLMLAFGLGTVPALLLVGGAAHWLGTRGRLWMMRGAGLIVALMGTVNLIRHLHMMELLNF